MYVDLDAVEKAAKHFRDGKPFHHTVIDGFFLPKIAEQLESEFPAFDSPLWHEYHNPLEIKKTCNIWNNFPSLTYSVFSHLSSGAFTETLRTFLDFETLHPDPGLHGGGWHVHRRGGKLNAHLDYNIHPKLGLQRKLNIIVYMNSQWQQEWGGQLGLWSADRDGRPADLVTSVDPVFNRAILFDTTQQSWHGLPSPLTCPPEQTRRSLAAYYLVPTPTDSDPRAKALYAPSPDQEGDPAVLELIKARAQLDGAATVYRT